MTQPIGTLRPFPSSEPGSGLADGVGDAADLGIFGQGLEGFTVMVILARCTVWTCAGLPAKRRRAEGPDGLTSSLDPQASFVTNSLT